MKANSSVLIGLIIAFVAVLVFAGIFMNQSERSAENFQNCGLQGGYCLEDGESCPTKIIAGAGCTVDKKKVEDKCCEGFRPITN